jgi:hypothetical protein
MEKLSPLMTTQNKQDMDNFKLHIMQQRLEKEEGSVATPAEIKFLAEQYNAGNQVALVRQSAATRLAVAKYLADHGTTGKDAANNAILYHGQNAEAGAAGRATGGIDVAGGGFNKIAPDALAASNAVPRSSWLVAGKVGNWLKEQKNDPALTKFAAFNQGLVREYARAFGGTVAAQEHAEQLLGTSKNQAAYRAAVSALSKEIGDASQGGRGAIRGAANLPENDAGGVSGIQMPAESDPDPMGLFNDNP